jgi:hypothetical protein
MLASGHEALHFHLKDTSKWCLRNIDVKIIPEYCEQDAEFLTPEQMLLVINTVL